MGNVGSGGTNAVDVLYAGFPAFLYLNPTLGRYLLEPLLESQVSNGVPVGQAYAPQDLGHNFPNVSSNTLPHNFGIKQSGNMLIMVLAQLQKSNDMTLVQTYYTLLKTWRTTLLTKLFRQDSNKHQ